MTGLAALCLTIGLAVLDSTILASYHWPPHTTMKTALYGIVAAVVLNVSGFAASQFSSVTTYSQEQAATTVLSVGYVTHISGSLPMTVDLANVNEATSFRINASTMWQGDNFQVLLGQDPAYKVGATKAKISTPSGTVQLSWTATNVTFSGVLADNYYNGAYFMFPSAPFPVGVPGPFTTNTTISIHFQYADYSHPAVITGTNKLVTYSTVIPPIMPFMPPTTVYTTVNTGQFNVSADLQPPVIKINSPAQNTVITSSDVDVNLTISDNVLLGDGPLWLGGGATLSYIINGTVYGDADTFPGLASTTHPINFNGLLNPGTNTIVFIAADSSGNLGSNTIVLFYSDKNPITLATNGIGGITGITNGQMLETGRGYVITAKSGPGKVFAGWVDDNGTTLGRLPSLTFTMRPGLMLTASFADNPFQPAQGTYVGDFLPSFAPNASQFGGVKITVGATGAFTGTLTSGAGSETFIGQFLYDSSGLEDAEVTVSSKTSTNSLELSLTTDPASGFFGLIQGKVYFGQNGVKSAQHKTPPFANLGAARVTNSSVLPITSGTYHFTINPATNDVNFPDGVGFGTLSVAASGTVTGSLNLADGDAPTATFSSQLVSSAGYLPVFVPLYNKGGGFLMALDMSSIPTDGSSVDATSATWVKSPGKKFYPDGFSTSNTVTIALYTNLPGSTPNGNINVQLDPDVYLGESIGLTNTSFGSLPGDPKVKGTITSSGAVSGTFVDNGISRTFKGLVLTTGTSPNHFEGSGFFVRSNQTGIVIFNFNQ